jgi:hypothetical protein
MVTLEPLIEHTPALAGPTANTTGLVEPPPAALTLNVPPGLNTGAAGLTVRPEITWLVWVGGKGVEPAGVTGGEPPTERR